MKLKKGDLVEVRFGANDKKGVKMVFINSNARTATVTCDDDLDQNFKVPIGCVSKYKE